MQNQEEEKLDLLPIKPGDTRWFSEKYYFCPRCGEVCAENMGYEVDCINCCDHELGLVWDSADHSIYIECVKCGECFSGEEFEKDYEIVKKNKLRPRK